MKHFSLRVLTLLGCLLAVRGRASAEPAGRRLIIFLDQSASIDSGQRQAWAGDAGRLSELLAPGWGLTLYALHDKTMDAAPLYDGEVPEGERFLVAPRQNGGDLDVGSQSEVIGTRIPSEGGMDERQERSAQLHGANDSIGRLGSGIHEVDR